MVPGALKAVRGSPLPRSHAEMKAWQDLRERRIIQILGSYLVAGWVGLSVLDQLIGQGVLPPILYDLALVLFIGGVPASLIIGWYHGEKGEQQVPRREVVLLSVVVLGTLITTGIVYQSEQGPTTAADVDSDLDASDIAVLYFEAAGSDEDLPAIADGLTESLIDRLDRVGRLDVVSRNGSRMYRGSDLTREEIARELDVGTLITGTVEADGDHVRISTQLVDGSTGGPVERGTVRVERAELLSGLDEVATEISRHLRQWLGEEVELQRERGETENLAAWTLLQRGQRQLEEARQLLGHAGADSALAAFRQADSLFAEAASLDTTWVDPLVGRARVAYRHSRAVAGDVPRAVEQIERGIGFANETLERQSNAPTALELRGTIRYWQWLLGAPGWDGDPDELFEAARRDLEEAVDTDPSLASAYSTLSHLRYRESITDAVLAAQRAYEQDAYLEVTDEVLWRLYHGSFDLGHFQQARRWCDEGARRFPTDYRFTECQLWLMITPTVDPDVDRAWTLQERAVELAPEGRKPYERALDQIIVGGVLARAGLADSARSVLLRTRRSVDQEIDPAHELLSFEAVMRTILGDHGEAVELLKEYHAANPEHSFSRGQDLAWWWNDLRNHPGFQELLSS